MSISDGQINAAVPDIGPTVSGGNPNAHLLNALLKLLRDAAEAGSGAGVWGQITGTLQNQTDLWNKIATKLNVPAGTTLQYVDGTGALRNFPILAPVATSNSYLDLSNKPNLSALDGVIAVANYAALPSPGNTAKLYLTQDDGKMWRWNGAAWVDVSTSLAEWGSIGGTLSDQTDLQNALDAKLNIPSGSVSQYVDGTGALQTMPTVPTLTSQLTNDSGFQTASLQWTTISGDTTIGASHNGKLLLITANCTLTIGGSLPAGWNVGIIPDDSKDATAHTITINYGGGSSIGNVDTVKGVCSIALTPTSGLFSASGAIE